jgi:hypothetical protein
MNLTEYQPHSPLRRRTGSSKPVAQHDSRAPVALRCVLIPPPSHTSRRHCYHPKPLGEDDHGESSNRAQRSQA